MDLSTTYMGLALKNPLVHSASPLSHDIGKIRQLEDAGAAAVVMYSLFEEQIIHDSHQVDHYLNYGSDSYGEALSYLPELESYSVGPETYLEQVAQAKDATSIPIIGSLNGVSTGGWIEYAKKIEEAGADGLEMNIYYIPNDPDMTGAELEARYVEVVREVKKSVAIPVAVKLSPFFSNIANVAKQLMEVGADALVLFNRFYRPDFDLTALEVVPNLQLSTSYEMRLPLRWIAMLYGRVAVDFAISRGLQTHEDVLKGLMAGANVTMMTSAVLKHGIPYITGVLEQVAKWMEEHEYESVSQMRGSMSQKHIPDPGALERLNYMNVLHSWRPDPTGRMMD